MIPDEPSDLLGEIVTNSATETKNDDDFKNERKQRLVKAMPFVISSLLFSASIASSLLALFVSRNTQTHNFKSEYASLASQIKDRFGLTVAQVLGACDTLSITSTSQAIVKNDQWPFVTLDDYRKHALSLLRLSDALLVGIQPIVQAEDREEWETNFTVQNDAWIWEIMDYQNQFLAEIGGNVSTGVERTVHGRKGYSQDIWRLGLSDGVLKYQKDDSPGPFVPSWQSYPLDLALVNFNYISFGDYVKASIDQERAILSSARSFVGEQFQEINRTYSRLLRLHFKDPRVLYQGQPASELIYPVYDSFEFMSRKVVAVLSATIFWPFLFDRLLPPSSGKILAVIKNTCGAEFSMEINGDTAEYLGLGDAHDKAFSDMVERFDFSEITQHPEYPVSDTSVPLSTEYCPYSLLLYPTDDLRDAFVNLEPFLYAGACFFYLCFLSALFLYYGLTVKHRFRAIVKSAIQSGNYVSSIFPEHVRKRLMEIHAAERAQKQQQSALSILGFITRQHPHPHHSTAATNIQNQLGNVNEDTLRRCIEKSIADQYHDCTACFVKLSGGFDEWCITRDPVDIFSILEAVFQCLDEAARHCKVFKVETIAETYLAVAGLPDPQPDHAWRMARFARRCLHEVTPIFREQAVRLGDPAGVVVVSKFQLTVGMHSGPITAGVMGGQHRFQVFGDTINFASRMMSTGQSGRIQLSEETANRIAKKKYDHWLQKREGKVYAKGKGEISTYWLKSG